MCYDIIDETGNVICKPSYVYLSSYSYETKDKSSGTAVFRADHGKWGFLDTDGNVIIEPVYDYAGSFEAGFPALVQKDGMCGAVRKDGSLAVEMKYQNIGSFTCYKE